MENNDDKKPDAVDTAFAAFIGMILVFGMLVLKFEMVARFAAEIVSYFSVPNILRWH